MNEKNSTIEDEIASMENVIVDFGCGRNKHPDANIGIDGRSDTDADIVHDLSKGIPLGTETVDKAFAIDVLEHIGDGIVSFMEEVHRVLKPGADFVVQVPVRDPPSKNPLHSRHLEPEWFYSWDPNRPEHDKWDNFTCVPFSSKSTGKKRHNWKLWIVFSREYTLTKINDCNHHPIIKHES